MDSECQTLKASLLFPYYPEGNTFVDLSLPLSTKLVIVTWYIFFSRSSQRLESRYLRNIGRRRKEIESCISEEKNQRTTRDRWGRKECVYRIYIYILFVGSEGRSSRKKIWLPKTGRLGAVPVYCCVLLESSLDNLLKLAVKYVIPGRIQAIR